MTDAVLAEPSARPDRRQLVLGGALLLATAGATLFRPRRDIASLSGDALERLVPRRIGPYRYASSTGLIVPDRQESSARIYDDVLTRVYVADDVPPVMLLIAYGSAQDAGLALHRPEACYPSSGYRLGGTAHAPLAGVPGAEATALTAARGDRLEQIWFWTRIGTCFPRSPTEEKLAILAENLRGALPDGVLVRLSMRFNNRPVAMVQMAAFNTQLLHAVGPAGRRLLLGTRA